MPTVGGIRTELIKKFRKQINDKTYKIKSDEIATKMASEIMSVRTPYSKINLKA